MTKNRYIALIVLIGLALGWLSINRPIPVVHAQTTCNQTVAISVSSGSTQTIAAAYGSDVTYVCGFVISGDTLATTGTFKSGSNSLTGAMRMADEGNIVAGDFNSSILFQTNGGEALTLTAATGAITGFIKIGRH